MKRLAIIPARGGSKRIPHKNIKDFCGKPMMVHSLEAAKQTGLFDTIHVSTDDAKIGEVAETYGFNTDFFRPEALSDDHATMMDAIKYVVEKYETLGTTFDTITLLYATSPLIDPSDLKKACANFEAGDMKKALLAVTSFPAPIEQAFRMKENADLYPDNAEALATRTQDLQHAFYDAGMFAIYSPEYIKAAKGGGDFCTFKGHEVPSFRVTDIDWPDDWARAEALYKAIN